MSKSRRPKDVGPKDNFVRSRISKHDFVGGRLLLTCWVVLVMVTGPLSYSFKSGLSPDKWYRVIRPSDSFGDSLSLTRKVFV